MTPKEKAEELVNKYFRNEYLHFELNIQQAILCAHIAVDIVLGSLSKTEYGLDYLNQRDYWMDVREILEDMKTI